MLWPPAEGAGVHLREARAPRIPVHHFPEVASSLRGPSVFPLDKVSMWRDFQDVRARPWCGPVSAPCEWRGAVLSCCDHKGDCSADVWGPHSPWLG